MARRPPRVRPLRPEEREALLPLFEARLLDRVRVRRGLPWGFGHQVAGVAIGRTVWLRSDHPGTPATLRLLAHEVTHVAQWSRDGAWRFLAGYLSDDVRGRWRGLGHHAAYLAIRHEVEAREAQAALFAPGLARPTMATRCEEAPQE